MCLFVPLFPECQILDAKISGEIYDLHPSSQQLDSGVHGNPMGRGIENSITLLQPGVIRATKLHVHDTAKIRKVSGYSLAL